MNSIKYTSAKLNGTGKQGILSCDNDGYYEMIVGGLNVFNSVGQYYTLKGAQELFESSSILMRRIRNGNLKSEVNHPARLPNQSKDDYIRRILTIDQSNVCCHFKEIKLDLDYGKNNPTLNNSQAVAIIAKLKPSGPKGDALKASLENKHENVCFSIRALTEDYIHRGTTYRVLNTIVNWDWVTEPGISIANKYDSPALESLYEQEITMRQLEKIVEESEKSPISLENDNLAFFALNRIKKHQKQPIYSKW